MKLSLKKRAKGQALVVFLGFAAAMIGMLLVSFNSGQVTNAKMRAMNAADAAAYSGAVWQARTLNFQAYMNRAIVVNEVAIAQSVSLRSWVDYVARFVANAKLVGQFIPPVAPYITTINEVMKKGNAAVQKFLPPFEVGFRALASIESNAEVVFNGFGSLGAIDIATDVANKNGAAISLGGIALFKSNFTVWNNFTETYTTNNRPAGTSGDGRKRLLAVTLDSRDGFTQNRGWSLNPFGIVKVRKQGGTDLVNYDAWKGLDSLAVCTSLFRCRWLPLAWGGGQASYPSVTNGIGTHGEGSDWNRSDGRLAREEANFKDRVTALKTPFPNYRDLKDLDTRRTAQQKIPFAVEVLIADSKVPTARSAMGAQAALTDGTSIEHDPQYAETGSGVYGLAEACVSFERPEGAVRVDKGIERPSLFNPYWRAALATPSADTRKTVGLTKLLPPVEAFFGGAGSCA